MICTWPFAAASVGSRSWSSPIFPPVQSYPDFRSAARSEAQVETAVAHCAI